MKNNENDVVSLIIFPSTQSILLNVKVEGLSNPSAICLFIITQEITKDFGKNPFKAEKSLYFWSGAVNLNTWTAIIWSNSLVSRVLVLPGVTTWQTSEGKAFLELRDQTDPHLYSAQSLPHCLLCLPDSLKLIRHPNTRSSWTATHKRMGTVTGVPYQQHLRRRARSLGAEEWMRKKEDTKDCNLVVGNLRLKS